ncbi:MAG: hypothetical protein ABIT83_14060 [Massilia sp.]
MSTSLSIARVLASSALIGMLSACAAAPANVPQDAPEAAPENMSDNAPIRSAQYSLNEGQQVALSPAITLRYDSFADSRCPQGVTCIWAGRISYRFTLAGPPGKQSFELTPGGKPFVATAFKNAVIALAEPQTAASPGSVSIDVSAP